MAQIGSWIAGVYPLAIGLTSPLVAEQRFADACREIPGFSGFEVPFSADPYPAGGHESLAWLHPTDRVIITQIPGTVKCRIDDPLFGLASRDDAARERALRFSGATRDAVRRVNDATGARTVEAVELHGAPGGECGSADALAESLAALLHQEWDGAKLLIEHCDAYGGPTPAKGFLGLEDEIEVARRFGTERCGVVINWARSVIETHDTETPVQHVRRAREAGVLAGVMFSGVSGSSSAWSPAAWADTHLPPQEALDDGAHSLLSAAHVAATLEPLRGATPTPFRGLKIGAPRELGVEERVGLLRRSAATIFG